MNPTNGISSNSYITLDNGATFAYQAAGTAVGHMGNLDVKFGNKTSGISPQLYFRYIKKKFGVIETMKLNSRIKRLEKAFNQAIENGQNALGEKFMNELYRECRESMMYAKGIKHFIEMDDLKRYKHKIRGGHISDTRFSEFTRVIPDDVLAKKKLTEELFDGHVIYHYWDQSAEAVREGTQKMTAEEKQKMRDPVLFGVIKESNRLYYIAEWDDEFCDLSFEELIDVIGGKDEDHTISRNPKLDI